MSAVLWSVPVLVLITVASLAGDEVYLTDGRIIDGEIVSAAESEVIDIRVGVGGLVAIQHFPRAKVDHVVYRVSARQNALEELHQQVVALAGRKDATGDQWWSLTRRLQDRGDTAGAKDAANHLLIIDRQHAEARKMLGMVLYHGVWMRPNEAATARGEVFFRGSWIPWGEQEAILADESRRREEQTLARKEREEQRRQARIAAAAVAEGSSYDYQDTYVGGYYRSPYYSHFGGWYYQGRYPVNGGGYPGYPIRPVTGGGCYNNGWGSGSVWHFGAVGGGSNHAWALNWTGASSGGTAIR